MEKDDTITSDGISKSKKRNLRRINTSNKKQKTEDKDIVFTNCVVPNCTLQFRDSDINTHHALQHVILCLAKYLHLTLEATLFQALNSVITGTYSTSPRVESSSKSSSTTPILSPIISDYTPSNTPSPKPPDFTESDIPPVTMVNLSQNMLDDMRLHPFPTAPNIVQSKDNDKETKRKNAYQNNLILEKV